MPFETKPFDLGNTLARAAQINFLRNRNELAKLNIDQTKGINNALATDDINSLSNFGPQGAKLEAQLTKFAREGKQAEFEQGLELARFANKAARGAIESVDPRQAAHLAVQGLSSINPEAGKRLGEADFLSMSPEEATSALQDIIDETDFSTRPDRVSNMTSPFEVRNIQQGNENVTTVLDKITKEPVRELGRGSRVNRVEQGAPGAFTAKTPSQLGKNVVDFEDAAIGATGAFQAGKELLEIGNLTPEALGKPGGVARFGNDMLELGKGLGKLLGIDVGADRNADAFAYEGFSGNLERVAVESSKFRSGIFGIAFAAAVAEQGTRPTDKDIQQFIDQIAGNSSSFPAFAGTIQTFMNRAHRRLKTTATVKGIPQADQERIFGAADKAFAEFNDFFDTKQQASPQALEFLQNNPDKLPDFIQKYGYTPEGF